jgi:hypothetical protein
MNLRYWLAVLVIVGPLPFLPAGGMPPLIQDGFTGQKPKKVKPPPPAEPGVPWQAKKPKAPPSEDDAVDKALNRWSRPIKPGKEPAGSQTLAAKLFRRLDVNRDGFLDGDEMPATLRAELARWDTDKDGRIDAVEYERYFEVRLRQSAQQRGLALPWDKAAIAGAPKEPERPVVYRSGRLPAGLLAWFAQLDTDGDGQVGLYEWLAAGRDVEEFRRLDRNGDGLLTAEEVLRGQKRGVAAPGQSRPK